MSRLFKLLPLAVALCASAVQADEAGRLPSSADVDNLYVGLGLFRDMLNVNVETVTGMGNFLVRAGKFQDTEGFVANVSWRKPLEGDDGHLSGYYIGFFGGHVQVDNIRDDEYKRLGAGAEIGYHWVKEYTRTELMVGLGAAEPVEVDDVERSAEPSIFFSVNVALGY